MGNHKGAYTPFSFDITSKLVEGTNSIIIGTKNYRGKEDVPPVNYDWWNYGGITRDVSIVELPMTFIENYSIQLTKSSLDSIKGWVQLSAQEPGIEVTIEIPECKWSFKGTTDVDGRVAIYERIKKLDYWSPSNPKLYEVKISTAHDAIEDKIGFRTIEVSENEILLNKKPIFLKGICLHDEILKGNRDRSQKLIPRCCLVGRRS